jgi:hypothetical protein
MAEDTSELPGARRTRLQIDAMALLTRGSGASEEVRVLDVSLSGLRVERPLSLPLSLGDRLDASLEARGRCVPALPARVVRLDASEAALEFEDRDLSGQYELAWMIERFGTVRDRGGEG